MLASEPGVSVKCIWNPTPSRGTPRALKSCALRKSRPIWDFGSRRKIVIEQQRGRICVARPSEVLFDVSGSRQANTRGVIPDGCAQSSVFVERFIYHIPCIDLTRVMTHHSADVILENPGKLRRCVIAAGEPSWILVVLNRGVPSHSLTVSLRESQDRVRRAKIIAGWSGMNGAEF